MCKLRLSDSVIERITPVCDRLDLDTTSEETIKVRCEICGVLVTRQLFNYSEEWNSSQHFTLCKYGIMWVEILRYSSLVVVHSIKEISIEFRDG